MGIEKPDEEVLFPGKLVCGHAIRPWTLAQAVALAPTLGALVDIAKEGGVGEILWKYMDLLDVSSGDKKDDAFRKVYAQAQKEVIVALTGLFPKLLPHAPKVIAATIEQPMFNGDGLVIGLSRAGLEKAYLLDLGQSGELMLEILAQNFDYLKNYFGPGKQTQRKAS